MSKTQKDQTIIINNVEYNTEDLTEEQVALVNHANDLQRKLSSARFNLDQLQIGFNAVMGMLTESLAEEKAA